MPLLVREVEHVPGRRAALVHERAVDGAAELLVDRRRDDLGALGRPEIGGDRERPFAQRRDGLGERILVARDQENAVSAAHELVRDRAAQAAASAPDHVAAHDGY